MCGTKVLHIPLLLRLLAVKKNSVKQTVGDKRRDVKRNASEKIRGVQQNVSEKGSAKHNVSEKQINENLNAGENIRTLDARYS